MTEKLANFRHRFTTVHEKSDRRGMALKTMWQDQWDNGRLRNSYTLKEFNTSFQLKNNVEPVVVAKSGTEFSCSNNGDEGEDKMGPLENDAIASLQGNLETAGKNSEDGIQVMVETAPPVETIFDGATSTGGRGRSRRQHSDSEVEKGGSLRRSDGLLRMERKEAQKRSETPSKSNRVSVWDLMTEADANWDAGQLVNDNPEVRSIERTEKLKQEELYLDLQRL